MSKKFPLQNICVVGLGLIGGSLAKALRRFTDCRVSGLEIDPAVREAALADGTIEAVAGTDFSAYDLVFFALYPRQTVELILKHLDTFRPGAILLDLCGVKAYPVRKLSAPCGERELIYIGGHPMAGREHWGFASAQEDLYQGASMLLTPDPSTPSEALEALNVLFSQLGFAKVVLTTAQAHDERIAFTSQLAHVVSSAYIKSPSARLHDGFSAGSYKDMTRVARLNPTLWTELFLENAPLLLSEIDLLLDQLSQYRNAIATQDAKRLWTLLDEGRRIKEELDSAND